MNLKKFIPILLILVLAIGLVACGKEKEEINTLKGEAAPNIKTTLTLYHKGDKLTKMIQVYDIEYRHTQFLDGTEAKEAIEPKIAELNKIEGYNEKVDYKDDLMTTTVEMDFTKISKENLKKIPGLNIDGDPKNGLSYQETLDSYTKQGFKEK